MQFLRGSLPELIIKLIRRRERNESNFIRRFGPNVRFKLLILNTCGGRITEDTTLKRAETSPSVDVNTHGLT